MADVPQLNLPSLVDYPNSRFWNTIQRLTVSESQTMQIIQRFRDLPRRDEAATLGILLSLTLVFIFQTNWEADWFQNYYSTASAYAGGNRNPWTDEFLSPPHVVWLLMPFTLLPPAASYAAFGVISALALAIGIRMMRGRIALAFLTFPVLFSLWSGQLDPIAAFGLSLTWWALNRERFGVMGIGFLLMSIKPHIVFFPALLLLWWIPRWIPLLKAALLPGAIIVSSFAVWGLWPIDTLERAGLLSIDYVTRTGTGIISLWPLLGPFSLLLLFILLLPVSDRKNRLLMITAIGLLIIPYSPPYSLVPILLFPLPLWAYGLANLPWLAALIPQALRAAGLLPLMVLIFRPDTRAREVAGR